MAQNFKEYIESLKQRLALPLPGKAAQERMTGRVLPLPDEIPGDARPSAVLCVLFPKEKDLHVLLIKRTEDGRAHSGQISFPGGRKDLTDADLRVTALREANEEVGIMSSELEILGALTPLYIPVSNFIVHPFLAFTAKQPEYNISHKEVAYVLEFPLHEIFNEEKKTTIDVTSPVLKGVIKNVRAYQPEEGIIVWGATAMMLSELEEIWKSIS